MYRAFYGLHRKPFQLTADPDFLYLSATHKKALSYLRYGVADAGNLVLLTGEVGSGKTTLLKALLGELEEQVVVAKVMNTRVSGEQLLELICLDFGLDPIGKERTALLHDLNTFLIEQYAQGNKCVVVVDEAQNLEIPMLEELRLLSNLESGADKLLQIILCGQPELKQTLGQPALRQFKQRINVSYHLERLAEEESAAYLAHRLEVAGGASDLFQADAVGPIHAYAHGIPRLINKVADRALLYGFVEERNTIDGALVEAVLNDIRKEEGSATAADGEEEEIARRLSEGARPGSSMDTRTATLLWNRLQQIEERIEEVAGSQQQIRRDVEGLPFRLEEVVRKATQGTAKTVSSIWDKSDAMERRLVALEERLLGMAEALEATGTQWSRTNDKLVPLLEQIHQVLDRHGAMLRRLSSLDLKEDQMLVRLEAVARCLDRLGEDEAAAERPAAASPKEGQPSALQEEDPLAPLVSAPPKRRGGFFRRR
ncbi:MAG: ATPase [Nitrospirae bacterium CG18_big_fil_WC_8_21_14_2_50_70_55]|nr:MAG: hypothetical protein AUK30_02495 [Nitrospirae bacterium CG2_30_70_394]PIQ03335.1 MAG: ATPase [Nitrospirae bacterium CG18_big_fil_WC_8_21_14_2_50_70_55]PIU77751.1 MAG: ATPase [Nitrospirae bacterium CG06_land_8_20_14_3_00_70_43]PIW81856.1 MAG: ATPase [Nitrospirae bacterium CG_4_8_14_3_um_filter_70_85]PIX82104.1 MAG: ATPase [Nitrospirae bacterium CG_4_10_14_3_um_filter_70_108]PJB95098.1 MAG: ATPase [Nitrospirae bacterium CG_4_9_14_0_8_um_filter_70_14]